MRAFENSAPVYPVTNALTREMRQAAGRQGRAEFLSLWAGQASPPQSQGFTLVGALLIIPMILVYTVWAYYVFRGKVRHDDGYH